jgi:hypothetical protein
VSGVTVDPQPEADPTLRWAAIWRAAVSVSVFLLPIGILQRVWVDNGTIEKDSPASFGIFAIILVLGAVAGFGAAKLAQQRPIPNGAAAAALAYLIVQGAGLVRRLFSGGSLPSPVSIVYLALLMATCGMLGAVLERRTRPLRD